MNNVTSLRTHIDETTAVVNLLVRSLVDDAESVQLNRIEGSQAVIFEVTVAPDDVRRLIGRKGRTADAVREILTNLGGKAGRRYMLEIVEPATRSQLARSA